MAKKTDADDKLAKFETALKEIAEGDALCKNDVSIQIAKKALEE